MEKQSQNKQIRADLEAGRRITALDALRDYGCLRLSGRIYDLAQQGLNIRSELVERNGKRIAQYSLNA